MATTTNYNWNIFIKGQKPYWSEWVTLMGQVDAELYKRSKDLYMQGKAIYGSDAHGDLKLYSNPSHDGKICLGVNSYYDEVLDGVYFKGHSAFGNTSAIDKLWYGAPSKQVIDLDETLTDSESTVVGLRTDIVLNPTSDRIYSAYGLSFTMTSQAGNSKEMSQLTGISGFTVHYGSGPVTFGMIGIQGLVTNYGAGHVGDAFGIQSAVSNFDANGIIDNAYGANLQISKYGGTIINGYGLYINDTYDQATNAWNIYSLGVNSRNYFEGKVGIGTPTPGSKLSIVGLPTSAAGLSAGDIWNNGGVLTIV